MRYLYALFFITTICFSVQAQRNFKPGYIVSLSGDTTKGLVDYRKWNQNPQEIAFELAGITKQYSYLNIKGFGIDQLEYYQLYNGPISKAAVNLGALSSGIDSSFTTETVFLKRIFKGKNIALYSYTDKIKTRFFISEKNGLPVELKRYVYLDKKRSGKVTEDNVFRQQLLELAVKYQPDNSKLADLIQKVIYRAPEVESVVWAIDGASGQHKKPTSSRGGVTLFAGLSANYFKTTGVGGDDFLADSGPSQSILPGVNLGMDMYFNKSEGKLIYRTEVSLSANNVHLANATSPVANNTGYVKEYNLSFNQFTVTLTPQLVYNVFNKTNIKAYLSGGVQINLTSYNNFDSHLKESLNNSIINDNHRTDPNLTTIYPGAIFKAGCVLNNVVELYAGYSTRAYLSNYNENGQSFNIDSYRVGVNYRFGK
ncbi:hypothetical protein ACFQZS_15020 [Mucilaginibacter calamicampi]|uniref:Outer membrane protein beta-barrel domain-containing protein n=1 Tax=Mucilaginibacter calamicampi TaxID=1302352 RepID=A0ABW2YZG4_9SPHI